jgi:hypothetical protein
MPPRPKNHQSEFYGGFSNSMMVAFIDNIFTLRAISKYQPYEFIHKTCITEINILALDH